MQYRGPSGVFLAIEVVVAQLGFPSAPAAKRAAVFVDGQNLYHCVKETFGYTYPNYSFPPLALRICRQNGWEAKLIHFYSGVPDAADDPHWHTFWANKLRSMGWQGVKVFSRPLRYRNETIVIGGAQHTVRVAREKGIDVRMAIDIIRLALRKEYDVALIFSQDQDFAEVADEVRVIAEEQQRSILVASAFPEGEGSANKRGINNTQWVPFDKALYDSCVDTRDYVPGRGKPAR
ncbi:MAG: NYN domain-containing protein [Planctomycetota bacterium]|nr:NYN domain-containing protein [Planctomycetota bacterium]